METNLELFFYAGKSMAPTLRDLDLVVVKPCRPEQLEPGDILVFRRPDHEQKVAHRLIAKTPQGLITQGDAIDRPDPWPVAPDRLVGKAIAVKRGDRLMLLRGGGWGRVAARTGRARRGLELRLKPILAPIYGWAAASWLSRRLLAPWFKPRVIVLADADGPKKILMIRNRKVGELAPGRKAWTIFRPYKLIVDESKLPHEE